MAIKGAAEDRHLEALRRYWGKNHQFPSIAKLCTVLGLASKNSVFVAMKRLVAAGYVVESEGRYAPSFKFFGRAFHCKPRRVSDSPTAGLVTIFLYSPCIQLFSSERNNLIALILHQNGMGPRVQRTREQHLPTFDRGPSAVPSSRGKRALFHGRIIVHRR